MHARMTGRRLVAGLVALAAPLILPIVAASLAASGGFPVLRLISAACALTVIRLAAAFLRHRATHARSATRRLLHGGATAIAHGWLRREDWRRLAHALPRHRRARRGLRTISRLLHSFTL